MCSEQNLKYLYSVVIVKIGKAKLAEKSLMILNTTSA